MFLYYLGLYYLGELCLPSCYVGLGRHQHRHVDLNGYMIQTHGPGTKLDNIQSMSCRVLGKTEQDLETQTSSISMGGCRGEPFFMSLGSSGMVWIRKWLACRGRVHPVTGPLGCSLDHVYMQTSLGRALSRRLALGGLGGEVLATVVTGFIVLNGEERVKFGGLSGVHLFWVYGTCWVGYPLRGRSLCSGRGTLADVVGNWVVILWGVVVWDQVITVMLW